MAREFADNPAFLKELAEDEKMLWKGAPEAFPLMSEENKKGLTRRWIICIVAAVVVVAGFIVLNAVSAAGLNGWVLAVALLIVAYFAFLPVVDRGNVYKKCKYYITDRRVILYYADRDVFGLPRTGLKHEITNAENGCIHIDLGSCVGLKGKKRRVAAFSPKKDDDDKINGFVMYNIADTDSIRALFS